jgi:hypothetical protein
MNPTAPSCPWSFCLHVRMLSAAAPRPCHRRRRWAHDARARREQFERPAPLCEWTGHPREPRHPLHERCLAVSRPEFRQPRRADAGPACTSSGRRRGRARRRRAGPGRRGGLPRPRHGPARDEPRRADRGVPRQPDVPARPCGGRRDRRRVARPQPRRIQPSRTHRRADIRRHTGARERARPLLRPGAARHHGHGARRGPRGGDDRGRRGRQPRLRRRQQLQHAHAARDRR